MPSRRLRSTTGLLVLALLLPPQSVFALLNIDGTKNQVFVFGSATVAYDSNVFAQAGGDGDYIYSTSLGVELKRRAGIIAVNATAVFDYERFAEIEGLNAWNPRFTLELNKTTGRTTGALTVNAFRSSRADSAVNLRTQTWNFPLGLNVKYPVNDNYYLTSTTSFLRRSYVDNSALLTYTDYGEAIDLFYVYTSKTDLIGGYRIRVATTDLGTTADHAFTAGLTNQILPKISGTVRAGYQFRNVDYTGESYSQITAAVSLSWNASRKFTVYNQIARDFTTTAVGGTVDTLSAMLRAVYTFSRRLSAESSVGYGRNRFLGGLPRQDEFFTWDVGGRYVFNDHLQVAASYNYMRNWSTSSFSDFERNGYSVNVSSRF